jgi:hypothetical protein
MQGVEEWNYPLFNAVTEMLRDIGFTVFNPAEFDASGAVPDEVDHEALTVTPKARAFYMLRDLPYVIKADAICLLPDWEQSTGANIELATALATGKEVWAMVTDIHGALTLAYEPDARPDLWKLTQHVERVYAT